MKLHNLLNEKLILLDSPEATKEEAILALLKTFLSHYPFKFSLQDLAQAVYERESFGGTSFPTGISVPHARIKDFNDIVILVLRPLHPLPDPIQPIRLLVLILTSQTVPTLYLNSLSSFLKISQNKNCFERLLQAESPRKLIDIVAEQDYFLVKVITVEDILSPNFPTIGPEKSLEELANLFYQKQQTYAPVVDQDNIVLGEISLLDLIKIGFPDYASHMGNLKFLRTFEPFATLLQQEETILVKEIMKPLSFGCDPSASVIELCFELIQKGRRHCPVLKELQLIGVVTIMDILNKVIRG